MARPRKSQDYVVHRVADLFRYSEVLPWSRLRQGTTWGITLADRRVLITSKTDIHLAVGQLLCNLKREYRPQILRRIADALEGKSAKQRKSGKADDIAKIRESWQRAKAGQKGLYKGENPTFKEVADQYHNLTGFQLDRRALKNADCPFRSEAKSKKLPRRI